MNLAKYSLSNIITYGLALFGPALIVLPLLKMFGVSGVSSIPITIIFYCVGAALMLLYLKKMPVTLTIEKKSTRTMRTNPIATGFIGIIILFAVQIIANATEISLTGNMPSSANTQNIMNVLQSNLLFTIVVSIAGPIMEELFFRRTLIGVLGNFLGFWGAAIISSFLFFLAHADGHFLIYFLMGMTLAVLYRYTGKIWTSMIAHCGMNTMVIVIQLVLAPMLQK